MAIRRLIAPRSIALIGAGAWTDAVAAGNGAIGYSGTIWRVHPSRDSTAATPYYRSIDELPGVPDAAFIAVPNHEVPGVASALASRAAGGFVCFSAGFAETGSDVGRALTDQLIKSAGALPFFGPNCYGYVNFFDRVAMMPDQIVGGPVERGVAVICQSGTIALTELTGAETWLACRTGDTDPQEFGIFDQRGLWFVFGDLIWIWPRVARWTRPCAGCGQARRGCCTGWV